MTVNEKGPTVYSNLGVLVENAQVVTSRPDMSRARTIILLLAGSSALMATGFGIIMPVFARRMGEMGGGVASLGLMTMAFALSQLIMAPFMGSLADRIGRKPLVLVGLAAFALSNIGYLMASTIAGIIIVRALAGGLSAGMFPAAMGVVSDIIPEDRRARWIGIVMGGYGMGIILGPALGGFLYDSWGFAAPFVVSAVLATLAFLAALILVPETRTVLIRRRDGLRKRRMDQLAPEEVDRGFLSTLPRPLTLLGLLLLIDFIPVFAFTFIEPQLIFYLYDELGWSTLQFGVVVGVYGLAMVLGQTLLGDTSDRIGRKPVIVLGLMLNMTLYLGASFTGNYLAILFVAAVAGLGAALMAPAMSAYFLDISGDAYRSRVMGLKESALALGGVLGPLAVVMATQVLPPTGIFLLAGGLVFVSGLLGLLFLREPDEVLEQEAPGQRAIVAARGPAAQAALQGVVFRAQQARTFV